MTGMVDECEDCFPRDRVILEKRPDGVFACKHRMCGTVTIAPDAPTPERYKASPERSVRKRCKCVNPNHPGGQCLASAENHDFCGPCQSEGAVLTPQPSTSALAAWLGRHDGHVIRHNIHGFHCTQCPTGDCVYNVAAWNEADTIRDASERSRAERAERRCEELSAEVKDRWTERERLAAKCADLSAEVSAFEFANRRQRQTITTLRANLADANEREANHVCETKFRTIGAGGTWQLHSCPPPLTNPTREEAIEALKKIRDRVQRFREGGLAIYVMEMIDEAVHAVVPE